MKRGLSLYARIVARFLLAFAIVGGGTLTFAVWQQRADPESPIRGKSALRVRATVKLVAQELRDAPRSDWDGVLAKWSDAFGAEFSLISRAGRPIAGPSVELPARVMRALEDRGGFFLRTVLPARYWMGVPIPLPGRSETVDDIAPGAGRFRGRIGRGVLLVVSDPDRDSGLLGDSLPWAFIVPALLAVSIAIWLPLARSLTRPIAEMTRAAEHIAQGRFDARVDATRTDELGRLARAINDMAARLDRLVGGQRRFLADVSHELRSPLTRMRVALEILEERAPDADYVRDLREDVDHMTGLVAELLAVARAESSPGRVTLGPVNLGEVIERAVRREARDAELRVDCERGLMVRGDVDLLGRAIANVARNAVRYAAGAGAIEVTARRVGGEATIEIADRGPGVPPASLGRLFEPFYRPDDDRARETGGAGLGLAIVKTCVESCGGTVAARNRDGGGFVVRITLEAAPKTSA